MSFPCLTPICFSLLFPVPCYSKHLWPYLMVNKHKVPSKSSTSMCYGTGRSLCSCSRQMLCCASPTCPARSRSSSLRNWCAPSATWSVASWCTVPPRGIPRATVLWSTWRRTRRPGPSRSSWGSSWAHVCFTSTGLRWALSHTHCCTPNACAWTACLRAYWQPKTSAVPWLTPTRQFSARSDFYCTQVNDFRSLQHTDCTQQGSLTFFCHFFVWLLFYTANAHINKSFECFKSCRNPSQSCKIVPEGVQNDFKGLHYWVILWNCNPYLIFHLYPSFPAATQSYYSNSNYWFLWWWPPDTPRWCHSAGFSGMGESGVLLSRTHTVLVFCCFQTEQP